MKKYIKIFTLMMVLVLTLSFMPAMAFADGDAGNDQQTPVTEDGVVPPADEAVPAEDVVVPGEETTPDTQDDSGDDEEITPEEDITPIGPGSIRLYGDEGIIPDEDVKAILDNAEEAYPASLKFTSGYPIVEETESGLWAARNSYWLYSWSMYCAGNKFDVTYSDGSTRTYVCIDEEIDGEVYNGYFELDAEGKPILNEQFFWEVVQSEDGRLTDENNKIVMVTSALLTSGGKEYYLLASSQLLNVNLQWATAYAEVRDTKGNFQAEYTGKDQKISLEKCDIVSEFGEVKAEKILSPSGGKIKDIGCHEITFKIDNSEGNFETDTVTGYFNIFPKRVKSVKVTNPKKNSVKVTWKYSGDSVYKANLKKIKGFDVMVYDKNGNFITEKKVAKNKTAVTLKSSKLKKGQKYNVEVRAYTSWEDVEFWSSEAVFKTIKLTK